MKVNNYGRTIQGLPARAVLEDEALPGAVADALASWREAVAALKEPREALTAAEREAGERIVRVRDERERWAAEVREATREEASALKAAERVSTTAAGRLVEALKEHGDEVRAIGARLALVEHVCAVDAWVEQRDAAARFARVAPGVAPSDLSRLEVSAPRTPVRSASSPLSGLEPLDLVNVPALLEILDAAPEDFGLVEVSSLRHMGVRLVTTPRRAEVLVGRGSSGWKRRDVEEVSA